MQTTRRLEKIRVRNSMDKIIKVNTLGKIQEVIIILK